jgi:ATP-binding cassette, subfamily B, bacterial
VTDNLHIIRDNLRTAREQWSYLPRTLALVWQATRGWTAIWLALLIGQGLLPVAVVYLTRPLVDSILAAARSRGDSNLVRHAMLLVAAMAAILLVMEILRSLTVWVRTAQSELLQDHIRELIHRKSVEADMAFYDSAEFHDHLHRARTDGYYRCTALLECMGSLAQNGLALVAIAGLLISFGVWLPLGLIASTLPALYVVIRYNLRQHQWRMRHTGEERRADYFGRILTRAESAGEIRLFGLGGHFRQAYKDLRRRLRSEMIDLAKGQSIAEFCAGVLALAIAGVALIWVFFRALNGAFSLGEVALFYQAFQQGLRLTGTLLENVGKLYVNSLFLGNLFAFLALEPQVKDPEKPQPPPDGHREGIQFSAVTFRYPESQRAALENFNLTIPAGSVAAIVGPNGSGKSTLVKLLCRFYDPEAGRIAIDGIDIRDLRLSDLRRTLSVVFQEPVRYNDTVADNIAFGDIESEVSQARIRAAVEAAGAAEVIAKLPRGYQSLLGRTFADGCELSVGEWQRVALARAFLRPAPILILDEPTSAMDPWAEAEWLERLRESSAGRTVLLITHRLTTAMRADVIYVVAQGRLKESGSHEQLLALGGLYADSWAAQQGYLPA